LPLFPFGLKKEITFEYALSEDRLTFLEEENHDKY